MNDEREESPQDRARWTTQQVRDGAGLCGLACLVIGTALLSVPWALIVCGALLLSMSVYGAVRSDRTVTRNPR